MVGNDPFGSANQVHRLRGEYAALRVCDGLTVRKPRKETGLLAIPKMSEQFFRTHAGEQGKQMRRFVFRVLQSGTLAISRE
jgi:hypothetical protein